jgi:hypothetical protein
MLKEKMARSISIVSRRRISNFSWDLTRGSHLGIDSPNYAIIHCLPDHVRYNAALGFILSNAPCDATSLGLMIIKWDFS